MKRQPHLPAYWRRLGSSISRTVERTELGTYYGMEMLTEANGDTTFAFTVVTV